MISFPCVQCKASYANHNRRPILKIEKRPAVSGAFPCVELRKREEVGDDEVMFLSVILSTLIGYHIRHGEWMDKL